MDELAEKAELAKSMDRATHGSRHLRLMFLRDQIGVSKVAEMLGISVESAKAVTADWLRVSMNAACGGIP